MGKIVNSGFLVSLYKSCRVNLGDLLCYHSFQVTFQNHFFLHFLTLMLLVA